MPPCAPAWQHVHARSHARYAAQRALVRALAHAVATFTSMLHVQPRVAPCIATLPVCAPSRYTARTPWRVDARYCCRYAEVTLPVCLRAMPRHAADVDYYAQQVMMSLRAALPLRRAAPVTYGVDSEARDAARRRHRAARRDMPPPRIYQAWHSAAAMARRRPAPTRAARQCAAAAYAQRGAATCQTYAVRYG